MTSVYTPKLVFQCPGSGIMSMPSNDPTAAKKTPLHDLAAMLNTGKYKNVVVLCGAGISTASGIPDFRSESGIYNQLQEFNLEKPTDMFDITYFRKNPLPFYKLVKYLYPGLYQPNPAHHFLQLLDASGSLLRVYTQNVDGLEKKTGLRSNQLIESHGSFASAHCTVCHKEVNPGSVKDSIFNDIMPICPVADCNGTVKPDIVFFGEALPRKFQKYITNDLKRCDLLIVMGTSLKAAPFAHLVGKVGKHVPRLLINNEKVGPFTSLTGHFSPVPSSSANTDSPIETTDGELAHLADKLSLKNKASETSDMVPERMACPVPEVMVNSGEKDFVAYPSQEVKQIGTVRSGRDIALLGDIVDSVYLLADLAGWQQKFQNIIDNRIVV